ncbi:MAG: single-stranded-DNA-specific exonuclease RecJ [Saprospiraceae bacterium]|nr:single-stranded-DNA-specific exonuclease RecJ [Saprospiraceae bacterium]
MHTHWNFLPADEAKTQALHHALGIHPVLCRLLVQRGIETFDQAKAFFRPSLDDLHDPFLMQDMETAVARLRRAIEQEEKILLYGDYDVDGATSVAMMYSFLSPLHRHIDYYIPDRYKEGYGISLEGIEYAREQGISLIIAMDCGITAVAQTARAGSYGIDLIICDHHLPGDALPAAHAVLDPKRPDCAYPYKELSGCGVAFKLAQAYTQRYALDVEPLHALLDFLAISVAADIVPMTGENRILAWYGLRRLNRSPRPGINALIEESRRQRPLQINDIVFGLAPMINAAGRLADAGHAVRLLLAEERIVAAEYARVLENRNQLRREFDRRTAEEATALFEPEKEERRSIVLYQPHWHKGIVGIAAARMVEAYHRPAILLTRSENIATGSARSVPGFDLHEALGRCSDLLISYGGHTHAAGLSLLPENVPAFKDRFEAIVQLSLPQEAICRTIPLSAEMNFEHLTTSFWNILRQFAPFGPGNRSPVFASRGVSDTGYSRLLKGTHIKLSLRQGASPVFTGIAFDQGAAFERVAQRKPFDICFTLEESRWDDRTALELVVRDMQFGRV